MIRPTQTPEKLENDYNDLSKRIKDFENLPVNWNSYGAHPSSEIAVHEALQIAYYFTREKKPYIYVFPCPNEDNIQFEYDINYGNEKIEIEFQVYGSKNEIEYYMDILDRGKHLEGTFKYKKAEDVKEIMDFLVKIFTDKILNVNKDNFVAYAGIGSRTISSEEEKKIFEIADYLKDKACLYSGNANGSDIAFQKGSEENCYIFLPYKKFNLSSYDVNKSKGYFNKGDGNVGNFLTDKLHPAPHNLTWKSRPFMNRNAYQILGNYSFPLVNFVVCCADEDVYGNVVGGTGHACRIAKLFGVPIFNIRTDDVLNEIKNNFNI